MKENEIFTLVIVLLSLGLCYCGLANRYLKESVKFWQAKNSPDFKNSPAGTFNDLMALNKSLLNRLKKSDEFLKWLDERIEPIDTLLTYEKDTGKRKRLKFQLRKWIDEIKRESQPICILSTDKLKDARELIYTSLDDELLKANIKLRDNALTKILTDNLIEAQDSLIRNFLPDLESSCKYGQYYKDRQQIEEIKSKIKESLNK